MTEQQQTDLIPERDASATKKMRARDFCKRKKMLLFAIFAVCFVFVSVFLMWQGIKKSSDSAKESFDVAFEKEKNEAYQLIYDHAFNRAEEKYHVTGRGTISVSGMRELETLEVMSVMNDEFIVLVQEDGDREAWYEATAEGVFTIDLSTAEYIVDNERQYVIVRSPRPILTNVQVSNTECIFETSKGLLHHGYTTGVQDAIEVENRVRAKMQEEININFYLQEQVEKRAVTALQDLVKQFNPNVEDIHADVEFMD